MGARPPSAATHEPPSPTQLCWQKEPTQDNPLQQEAVAQDWPKVLQGTSQRKLGLQNSPAQHVAAAQDCPCGEQAAGGTQTKLGSHTKPAQQLLLAQEPPSPEQLVEVEQMLFASQESPMSMQHAMLAQD